MPFQKALYLSQKQGPFVVSDRDIPTLGEAPDLLVKVHAAGINPLEWKIQQTGLFYELESDYPAVLGIDVAGEVISVGPGTANFDVGDRVLFQGQLKNDDFAGYQQFAKAPSDLATKIPSSLTYSQAATIPACFATAAMGLFSAPPKGAGLNPTLDESIKHPNTPVLIVGGSSSVGQYAIQLLKWGQFSPIITYASSKNTALLTSLGATHVIDRAVVSPSSLSSEVSKIIGGAGLKTIFVTVSDPETQEGGYACLAEEGTLIVITPPAPGIPQHGQQGEGGRKVCFIHGTATLNREFARVLFGEKLQGFLENGVIVTDDGMISNQPNKVEYVSGGLVGVQEGVERLRNNQVSGAKLVVMPQETKTMEDLFQVVHYDYLIALAGRNPSMRTTRSKPTALVSYKTRASHTRKPSPLVMSSQKVLYLPKKQGDFVVSDRNVPALAEIRELLVKIPKSLTYSEAATLPVAFSTAAMGLFSAPPKGAGNLNPTLDESLKYPNTPALVVGGSSCVGEYVIQLLKWARFTPIITYAFSKHASRLTSLGATDMIDRGVVPPSPLPTEVAKVTGGFPLKTALITIGDPETQVGSYEYRNTH
ncbi:hypothetical protein V5O48_008295 [Marasmius crinis-equi]|uniref:Enoyl reductase (ER) domain-containing protein n=1 Tax=Marasmius crinis-equi TaxID=585013 RepID=A0ABR3FEF3_9AGAR